MIHTNRKDHDQSMNLLMQSEHGFFYLPIYLLKCPVILLARNKCSAQADLGLRSTHSRLRLFPHSRLIKFLTHIMLGKKFSRRHFETCFSQKIDLTFHA